MCRIVIGLLFLASGLSTASVITSNPNLPPNVGGYVSPSAVHACYPNCANIDLNNIVHSFFTNIVQTPVGPNESETFNSTATGTVSVLSGPFNPITLSGPVQTLVFGKVGNVTGTFATEMLSLNLSGGGVMLRESPTLQSTGQTTITNIGGGNFQITSFFDVFTELSVDGGVSWIPSSSSTHVNLQVIPEPGTVALMLSGLALCAIGRRRRR